MQALMVLSKRYFQFSRPNFTERLCILAIGLQEGWKTFQWISTLPPIGMMIAFKIYIDRTFLSRYNWYIPSEEEIRLAHVHSERSDVRGGRLEKRFGHPALHAELFTPMLHAKMMPLLPEVYHGRIANQSATLEEFGGQKMEASVLPGGIKIAAVHQVGIFFTLVSGEWYLVDFVLTERIGIRSGVVSTRSG